MSEFESGSLNDFYSNYKYKVRTSEDTIVFESKFIEQLEIHYPKFVEHLYLISVEMDVLENPKFIPDSIKKFDPVKDAPKISEREFNINHVAGKDNMLILVILKIKGCLPVVLLLFS